MALWQQRISSKIDKRKIEPAQVMQVEPWIEAPRLVIYPGWIWVLILNNQSKTLLSNPNPQLEEAGKLIILFCTVWRPASWVITEWIWYIRYSYQLNLTTGRNVYMIWLGTFRRGKSGGMCSFPNNYSSNQANCEWW